MKKLNIIIYSLILLLNGCSQKTTSTINPKCQKIEQKLIELENEKKLNLSAKITNTIVNGYPYSKSSENIEQRIKVLRMKLDECKRDTIK